MHACRPICYECLLLGLHECIYISHKYIGYVYLHSDLKSTRCSFCFTFCLGLPSNSNTQTVSAPESISGSKGLPSFDTFSHHPRLFQQQYDTTEILDSGSQKEFYSTCNNSYTAPSRFAEISSTCEIRRSVIQEEISLKQDFCK